MAELSISSMYKLATTGLTGLPIAYFTFCKSNQANLAISANSFLNVSQLSVK